MKLPVGVIDLQTGLKLLSKAARRQRQGAAFKLRPALNKHLRSFISETLKQLSPTGKRKDFDRQADYELVDLTKKRRGRPKGTRAHKLIGCQSNKKLADAILHGCLAAWMNRKEELPSEMSVAEAIARRLGVEDESRFAVGRDLMTPAIEAGIIRVVKTYDAKRKRQKTARVTLTEGVCAALCDLESREPWPMAATGFYETSEIGPLETSRGSGQKVAGHVPVPLTPPWDAAVRIRATPWRLNNEMVIQAGEWLQNKLDAAGAVDDSADLPDWAPPSVRGSWRRVLDTYQNDIAAYRQATRKGARSGGHLHVRFEHRGRINQVDSLIVYTGGSDLARGILEFKQAKRVETDAGRQALARHALNQWSSRESRSVPRGGELAWIEAHRSFNWYEADNPLRFLAAIRAWNASEHGEAIRLPVSIDATTSVLQHIALLLRDVELAKLSNLWPGERRDFYSEVASAANITGLLPPNLAGKERNLVKPLAMPALYGLTDAGARRALWDAGLRGTDKADKAQRLAIWRAVEAAARRIAPTAFRLYDAVSARAAELALAGEPIRWTTPSSWECCTARLKAVSQEKELKLADGKEMKRRVQVLTDTLHWKDQANAATANLVHSLDATLLHLTVAALPEDMSIAVAHDCFAVHADDVTVLRRTLMSALQVMYAGDVDLLGSWWAEWGETEIRPPERGEWRREFLEGANAFI